MTPGSDETFFDIYFFRRDRISICFYVMIGQIAVQKNAGYVLVQSIERGRGGVKDTSY